MFTEEHQWFFDHGKVQEFADTLKSQDRLPDDCWTMFQLGTTLIAAFSRESDAILFKMMGTFDD